MNIHLKIKECVNKKGADIIVSNTLIGMLDDELVFDDVESAPYKKILRNIIKEGYAQKLLDLGSYTPDVNFLASQYANKNLIQESSVLYVLDCLAYGLGWINKEPVLQGTAEGASRMLWKKEASQEIQTMANVNVRADADCFLLCDGEYLDIQLEAGKLTKIQLPIGQHLLEFIYTEDANIKLEKVVDFPEAGKNYLVIIQDLKGVIELANSEPYAVYENGTLTFYFDTQKSNRGGMGFEIVQYDGFKGYKWHEHKEKIRTVIFDESFSNCHCIESTCWWFYMLGELTLIKGLNNLDTSKVTDMSGMFAGCWSLQSLDVSGFDTSKVTDIFSMFNGCSSLKSLDVSGFDTSKVTDMSGMFKGCSSLQSLDVSGFDTSKVTSMSGMFNGCSSLKSLDVSGFDTSKVTYIFSMFDGCSSLKSLDVSGLDTSKVTSMSGMFNGCLSLKSLDVSGFDTSKVTNMRSMFYDCRFLQSLDVSGFDTSKVTDMSGMFSGCSSLKSLDVSGFETSKATDMSWMFNNCSSLQSLDVSGFDTSKVTTMYCMFNGCSSLKYLDVSRFDTSKVMCKYDIFKGIDMSKIKIGNNYRIKEGIN